MISDIIKTVSDYIKENSLIPRQSSLLVTCSGGLDSVCLVDILRKLSEKFEWRIIIAHYNHKQRGKDSEKDAAFVESMAKQWNIPCIIGYFSQKHGQSENFLRKCRYLFFEETAKSKNITHVVTAHHQNDQVETFLYRMLRGSHIKGLRGILPQRLLCRSRNNIFLSRPFLCLKKNEIHDYALTFNLSWREDKSNLNCRIARNRIRNHLLPYLKTYNSNSFSHLNQITQTLKDHYTLIKEIYEANKSSILNKEGSDLILNIAPWKKIPSIIQTEFLYHFLQEYFSSKKEITSKHIHELKKICYSEKTEIQSPLSSKFFVWKSYEHIKIQKIKNVQPQKNKKKIPIPGIISLFENKKYLKSYLSDVDINPLQNFYKKTQTNACCDYKKIIGNIYLSPCSPQEKISPFGRNSFKTVKNFFSEKKILHWNRSNIPIVKDTEKIIWICGYTLDQRVACDEKTKKILHLQIKKY